MSGVSNYGATFTKGGSAVGQLIVLDLPEETTEKINVTTHASNGKTEYIPSKLVDVGDVSMTVLVDNVSTLQGIANEMAAETVNQCVAFDGLHTHTFSGWYLSVDPTPAADAQNPDAVKLDIVLAVTGGIIHT